RPSTPTPPPAAPQCPPAATSTSLAPTIRASSTIASGTETREQSLRRQFRARGAGRAREASHELVHRYHGCSAPGAGSARCPGPRPPSRAQARRAAGEPPRSLGAERFHGAGGRFARAGVAGSVVGEDAHLARFVLLGGQH